jgi:hypothetical protein
MQTRFIRNSKGQVAIFVALMFQVLFLFFAMIVNVGLLVHHKINLQNSVDLAAYYGASKQAEVLNAIAHVNYQIRQSWKLLVWRQKVLGTAGVDPTDPSFPVAKLLANGASVQDTMAGSDSPPYEGKSIIYSEKPTFCISYDPHEVYESNAKGENTCKHIYEPTVQAKLPAANVLYIPGFLSFGTQVAAAITQAAKQASTRCADVGSLNYFVGGSFIAAHYRDADERAFLMNVLASGLSSNTDNFYELSGDQVKTGLEKTLKKNLTSANNASVEYEIFNSMGTSPCKDPHDEDGGNAPTWLVPIYTMPVWRYWDCYSSGQAGTGVKLSSQAKQLVGSQLPTDLTNANPDYQAAVKQISTLLPYRRTLVGFEKDPWCVPYIGVKATAKPKIPFMPLSEITITAESYAKPFGGRVGPWYVKDWPQGQSGSSREAYHANNRDPSMVESIGPVRVTSTSGIQVDDATWASNVARFPGDPWGFNSEKVLAYFQRAILGTAIAPPNVPGGTNYYPNLYPTPKEYPFPVESDSSVSLKYYDNVASDYTASGPLDSLSWDQQSLPGQAPRLRLMEIAAMAPTLFDLAYYSIDPDFYHNYFTKIESTIAAGTRPGWKNQYFLLGDYGWRANDPKARQMNIFDQIRIQRDVGAIPGSLESDTSMPYVVKKPMHLLNSWAEDNLLDYKNNSSKFAKCYSPGDSDYEKPMNPPAPGNCVDGGRVGYSVKFISKDWLNSSDLELGGTGVTGPLRNPPSW